VAGDGRGADRVRALEQRPKLFISVQVEVAWGKLPAGDFRGIQQDFECDGGAQDAPITAPVPLREAPFWAVEFQPTITFTLGGVRVDPWGRVLDRDGAVVSGLYCAGGDAGGLQGPHYVAGLMLGMVFGPRAVEAVVMDKEEIDV